MKQYSTFLFDFDGTLLDSNAHVIRCFQLAFQEVLGVTLPEETITATFGIPLAEALENLAPAHAEELLRVYRKYSDACGMSLLQEIDGARAVLEALHARGCTNAIVTSSICWSVRKRPRPTSQTRRQCATRSTPSALTRATV